MSMATVPDPACVLPQASRGVSFDVFDGVTSSCHSDGSTSGRGGFGSPLRSPKQAVGVPVAVATGCGTPKGPGHPGFNSVRARHGGVADGLISAYRNVDQEAEGLAVVDVGENNKTPSAVERAKARLASWKTMADRLEGVMVREEQSRLLRETRQSSPGTFKTISQLRKEIHAMRADTHVKKQIHTSESGQSEASATAQRQVTLLEAKVVRYEAKVQKRDDAIAQLKTSVSQLQNSLLAKQQQLQRAKEDAEVASRLAEESASEFTSLKASSDRSFAKIKGLQAEVAALRVQLEDSDVSLKQQEQMTAVEKSRRLELEQRLVDTDDAISRLKTKVESSKKRMNAAHDALEIENRGLRDEVVSLQEACLEAKRLATEHAEAVMEVSRQRDALERDGVERKLEMKELRAALHIERQRARVAEEAAAEAAAELYVLKATEKRDAAELASVEELRLEFAATKKVLDTMTANAKVAKAEVVALKDELRKAQLTHQEEVTTLKKTHEQALITERKGHMDALREIEASHAAQIRQDVDRIERARATLVEEVEEMAEALRGKDVAIDDLQRMLKERETSLVEMTGGMESMKAELMQTQDEVEALLTARLKDELDKAGGNQVARDRETQTDVEMERRPHRSPIKKFIARLSPKKKTQAAREGLN